MDVRAPAVEREVPLESDPPKSGIAARRLAASRPGHVDHEDQHDEPPDTQQDDLGLLSLAGMRWGLHG